MGKEEEPRVIREAQELADNCWYSAEELKADLRERCLPIPESIWLRFYSEHGALLMIFQNSSISPIKLWGYQEIQTYLTSNGVIMERLVHYEKDFSGKRTKDQDELLGEVSDERYRELEREAISRLEYLEKLTAKYAK